MGATTTQNTRHECRETHKKKDRGVSLSLMVDAANGCQLHCRYCYFGQKGVCLMHAERVFRGIVNFTDAFGSELTAVDTHYMGGEPLLAWGRILELNTLLRQHFSERGVKFTWGMTSNLVSLSKRRAEHMQSEHAGIHCSIDGPRDIQDRNRPLSNGGSGFQKVIEHIPLALRVSPNDTARVTVCPEDAHRLPEIASFIFDCGFKHAGLFPAYNMGWDERTMNVFAESMAQAIATAPRDAEGKPRISTMVRPDRTNNGRFTYCGAGRGLWAFDVEGRLFHCHHFTNMPELAIIDASTHTPEEIAAACKASEMTPKHRTIPDACAECPAKDVCNGGCWASNFLSNGSSVVPETIACRMHQLTYAAISHLFVTDTPPDGELMKTLKACKCDACDGCQSMCEVSCQSCEAVCDFCNVCEGAREGHFCHGGECTDGESTTS